MANLQVITVGSSSLVAEELKLEALDVFGEQMEARAISVDELKKPDIVPCLNNPSRDITGNKETMDTITTSLQRETLSIANIEDNLQRISKTFELLYKSMLEFK